MDDFIFSEETMTLEEALGMHDRPRSLSSLWPTLVVATDTSVDPLAEHFDKLQRIVVISRDFNDGRMFSIGRQLRLLGYTRRLTVVGDLLPDQYSMLLSCGFDDVLFVEQRLSPYRIDLGQTTELGGIAGMTTARVEILATG